LFFTDAETVITPRGAAPIRMTVAGAHLPQTAQPLEATGGISNYLRGNDRGKWRTSVPQYRGLRYPDVLPGIDQVFHSDSDRLEFDFAVAPGADPRQIAIEYRGAKAMRIDAGGDLLLATDSGQLRVTRPILRQRDASGKAIETRAAFCIEGSRVAFVLPRYDATRELVIDPVIQYSTYLGGDDSATGVAVDSAGNAYVVGLDQTPDPYFTNKNPTQIGSQTQAELFIAKVSADGKTLVYLTYIGVSFYGDQPIIAVDGGGNAYVAGSTTATSLQTLNAFQSSNAGAGDVFVIKLNPNGSALVYSTYLGGKGTDIAYGIAVDSGGSAYVTGSTSSPDFPIVSQFQASLRGVQNAFVTKLAPNGSSLAYSTYLGGVGSATGQAIAVDSAGSAYVTGSTSGSFPTMNPFQPNFGGDTDAFVTKLAPNGASLVYSTYLGGALNDYGYGIAVDPAGNAYVTGEGGNSGFPTKNPFQPSAMLYGAFITKINASGSALIYSSLFGSSGTVGTAIAVDVAGNAYFAGLVQGGFPALDPLLQTTSCGTFVAEINSAGSAPVFASCLDDGGSTVNVLNNAPRIAVDSGGAAYLAGIAGSGLPIMNALQPTGFQGPFGSGNAYLMKIAPGTGPPSITQNGVVPIFSTVSTVQPGSWVSIYGSNLASATATWNGDFPVSLGGTSVTIDGKAAYLWFVSPSQINLQVPDDATTGSVSVVVTTGGGTASTTVTLGQLGPSLSLLDGKHIAGIILRANGSGAYGGGSYDIIGPTGTSLGYPTVAAKAGDTLELFGVGFGPTNPAVPAGKPYSGSAPTTNTVQLIINGTAVLPSFAGITSAGLYQFNIPQLPSGLGTGDVTLQATVAGVRSPSGVVITLQ
jgi:uncharacterized protein (TIGR03437 family)